MKFSILSIALIFNASVAQAQSHEVPGLHAKLTREQWESLPIKQRYFQETRLFNGPTPEKTCEQWLTEKKNKSGLKIEAASCYTPVYRGVATAKIRYVPMELEEVHQLARDLRSTQKKLNTCSKDYSTINSLNRDVKDIQKSLIEKEGGNKQSGTKQ